MGCVSSTILNQDEELTQMGFSHHIVSLTSTTYGLLTTLDNNHTTTVTVPPKTPPPPPRTTLGSLFPSPILSEPRVLKHHFQRKEDQDNNKQEKQQQHPVSPLETINSWDLMYGLDSDHISSFRVNIVKQTPAKADSKDGGNTTAQLPVNDENEDPNVDVKISPFFERLEQLCSAKNNDSSITTAQLPGNNESVEPNVDVKISPFFERFEPLCPPNGEDRVVMYSTSLRGVRKTFEDCNAVRSTIHGLGIAVCERDISMDRGFREELRELMKGKGKDALIPPRVFVKGRYVGGVDEMMRIVEEGCVWELVKGLPKLSKGVCNVCEGCGGVGFLPCFTCHGSCKLVAEEEDAESLGKKRDSVVRCGECNENGLVLCPICS